MSGTNLGISDVHLAESVDVLNAMLADESILLIKTTKAHWGIRSSNAHALHALWTQQVASMGKLINEAGERVRALGAFPFATAAELLRGSSLTEERAPFLHARGAVDVLRADHEHLCRALRLAARELPTAQSDDVGTLELLTRAVQFHEQCASMLGASVEGLATTDLAPH